MKFLGPKTLSQAFSPMLLINWLLGIGVFECPMDKPRPIISAVWSMVNFLIYLGFLRMANFSQVVTFHGSEIAAHNYRILDSYFGGPFVLISMLVAHIGAKTVRKCHHKLSEINDRLKTLGIPNDFEVAFKSQIIYISFVFVSVFIMAVWGFKKFGFSLPTESSRVGFLLVSHYLLVFAFVVDANFCTCVRYIGNRFLLLNTLLSRLEPAMGKTTISQEPDGRFQSLTLINGIHPNNSVAMAVAENQWLLHVIRESRKIHRGLCKTATELNRAFGIQMLFSMAVSFGMITVLLYTSYIIASMLFANGSRLDEWLSKCIVLMWISSYVIKVLLIVEACETTSYEANRTGELISNLRIKTPCDQDIRDEINIFSLQLIQNPLNFTASGFFRLNYTLVRGIIRSVTTYLVIMIQMHTAYEPQNVDYRPKPTKLIQTNGTD